MKFLLFHVLFLLFWARTQILWFTCGPRAPCAGGHSRNQHPGSALRSAWSIMSRRREGRREEEVEEEREGGGGRGIEEGCGPLWWEEVQENQVKDLECCWVSRIINKKWEKQKSVSFLKFFFLVSSSEKEEEEEEKK